MKARDVMISPVITVTPSASVADVAALLLKHRISAVPVVDERGAIAGIISEGDLLHRAEAGTERRRSWWLRGFARDETLADDFVKAHARRVADVMTRKVITTGPDAPLHEVAALLERNAIKRVPVIENGTLVGIVSRANLIQAVAGVRKELERPVSDSAIREKLLARLKQQPWAHPGMINVTVNNGVVDLWGWVDSDSERAALRVAAETTEGVTAVNDNMVAGHMQSWL